MKRRTAIVLAFLLGSAMAYSIAAQPKTPSKIQITGFFHDANEHSGNFYGHTILVYHGIDYWVVYQKIDEQEMPPIATQAKVVGNTIEFTIEPVPGEKATFRGKIEKDYLVGKFDNLSLVIKLKRRPL
jgi:hypothetical protein